MSEALLSDDQEPVQEEIDQNPDEQRARERGWVSKDEWESNPDNEGKPWFDAHDFNLRGEFIGEIKSLQRQMEEIRGSTRELIEQERKAVRESAEKRVRAELAAAVEEGDTERAQKAADDLREMTTEQPKVSPLVAEFEARNKDWYNVDPEMTATARALDMTLYHQGHTDQATRFAMVERQIKERIYADKFKNPARDRAPSAESGGIRTQRSKKAVPPLSSLPEEFQSAGRKFVKHGLYASEQDYVKSLMEDGAI